MTTVHRIVISFALILLPLGSLLCQQTSAKQNSATRGSGSELVLNFGPAASNAEGKAAAARLLQAMGGPAKVNAVKSLRQSVAALRQGQHIELEQSIVYPDKQAQRMVLPQGRAPAGGDSKRRLHGDRRPAAQCFADSAGGHGPDAEARLYQHSATHQ